MNTDPILVVDDEKNIRLTMSQSLEPLDRPIHTAVNGEEALRKLGAQAYGLVFLDLKMPGMDGLTVLRRITRSWPQTRVVIITAHGTVDYAVEAMKLGAADFLQKPFSPDDIRKVAAEILERETLTAENALDYVSLVALGKRRITDRQFDLARDELRKAIAADPSQPEVYNLLGALLEIQGRREEALKYYRAALDIDPAYQPAWSNLDRATSWGRFGTIDLGPDDRAAGNQTAEGEQHEA